MFNSSFGRTRTTADELWSQVDIEIAVEKAREGGVDHPEERINQFIQTVPQLLVWLESHGREYPWRKSDDPWEVYIAEILLQRTRADAVEPVYLEFLKEFPNPESLVEADDDKIQNIVRSLGFVNHRTRTLKEVGEIFTKEYNGEVPNSIEELKRPWRVGDYSARACQIFARGEAMALVDSNFARVFSRILGYEMPRQPHKSSEVYALLDALVPSDAGLARAFNLAVLDIGALICTPEMPQCQRCPLVQGCKFGRSRGTNPD